MSLDDGGTGAVGPATVGGNSCTGGQICAMVTLTNDSARQIENPHVEIIDMTGGATLSNPSSLPSGYPTSGTGVGGWGYSAVPGGGSDTAFWAFNTSGGADFNFNVKVWGTYTRTSYTAAAGTITATSNVVAGNAAWSESTPPWRDACLFGSVVTSDTTASPLSSVSSFDYGLVEMPFPFTLYSSTFSSADGAIWQVTTNGAISLQGTFGDPNTAIASAPQQSLLPFWDEKLSITNGQICAGVDSTSAAPNRRYVITWKEAQLAITGNTNNRLSFSVVFQETTDNVFFLYHRWTTNLTGCALSGTGPTTVRGDSATIGVTGDIGQSTGVSFNTAYLPNRSTFAACPGVGYFVKLTATPTNP